jgi:hypothetical protein
MDDALLGADRAVAEDDGVEIGSDAKAHALAVTAAFVRSQLIHCRLGRTNRTASGRVAARFTGCPSSSLIPGNKIQDSGAEVCCVRAVIGHRTANRQRGSAGATESPSMSLRATESTRKPLERISASAALINRRRSGRSSVWRRPVAPRKSCRPAFAAR